MRMLRFDSRTVVSTLSYFDPTSAGTEVCGGREARSRITSSRRMKRAIAGSTTANTSTSTVNTVSGNYQQALSASDVIAPQDAKNESHSQFTFRSYSYPH